MGATLRRWLERFEGEEQTDSPRLDAYQARVRAPLDLLALVTAWTVVPPGLWGGDAEAAVVAVRIALTVVYGVDLAIRVRLSGHPLRYLRTHPLSLAAVIYPTVRVLFSWRLLRSIFKRGELARFLVAELFVLLDGTVIVYLYERHAPDARILTFADALWWAAVTVTTVGYGDFFPITTAGRITAVVVMASGVITLAVITANVASSFFGASRASAAPEVTLDDLDRRLARIESLIADRLGGPPTAADTDASEKA